ncbi:MAG: hypothetical protein HQL13_01430 [Candidatus Omnitrophica bacterium]|nr:hypothetical protein [Candidatus Omnitrophota bacterium]
MIKRVISIIVLIAFILTPVQQLFAAQALEIGTGGVSLPAPGGMVHLSPSFIPAHLQGLTMHPDNALRFDFLIDKGQGNLAGLERQKEYERLIKYFLASLTIPEENQWVNLSPYEKNRIINNDFGKTEMGRDLLAADYMLKQMTSSLMYPEEGLGKRFWDKIYERAWTEFHTRQVPVNTFNKVWIIPDRAIVYESGNSVYILQSHLKVMLEEDYLALQKQLPLTPSLTKEGGKKMIPPLLFKEGVRGSSKDINAFGSQIIRQLILPELEKEVNEGKNFSNLRQMYSGMILAFWYKKAMKESFLGKIYADKNKTLGVGYLSSDIEKIYEQYLMAFKKGVFNYIKEDVDKYTHEAIPRKYFSGGCKSFAQVVTLRNSSQSSILDTPGTEIIAHDQDLGWLMTRGLLPPLLKPIDRVIVDMQPLQRRDSAMPSGLNHSRRLVDMTLMAVQQTLRTLQDTVSSIRQAGRIQKLQDFDREFEGLLKVSMSEEERRTALRDFTARFNVMAEEIYGIVKRDKERAVNKVMKVYVKGQWVNTRDQQLFQSEGLFIYLREDLVTIQTLLQGTLSYMDEDGFVQVRKLVEGISAKLRAYCQMMNDVTFPSQIKTNGRVRPNGLYRDFLAPALRQGIISAAMSGVGEQPETESVAVSPEVREYAQTTLRIFQEMIKNPVEGIRESVDQLKQRCQNLRMNVERQGWKEDEKYEIESLWGELGPMFQQIKSNALRARQQMSASRHLWISAQGERVSSDKILDGFPIVDLFYDLDDKVSKMEQFFDFTLSSLEYVDDEEQPFFFNDILNKFNEYLQMLEDIAKPTRAILIRRVGENLFSRYESKGVPLMTYLGFLAPLVRLGLVNQAQASVRVNGGIDFNSVLDFQIKRDSQGKALPWPKQDMAQLAQIQGLETKIVEIRTEVDVPILMELRQKLQEAPR